VKLRFLDPWLLDRNLSFDYQNALEICNWESLALWLCTEGRAGFWDNIILECFIQYLKLHSITVCTCLTIMLIIWFSQISF